MGAQRAAIYIRVSTAGQEDGYSLPTQEQRCREHAEQHGYAVERVYREVYSGVQLWERPQLTALREAIRRRGVDVVLAYDISRLAREPVHLGVVLSEADHAGVRVEFVSEPLDDSAEGQLIRFVRGYAAKVEHLKFMERSRRGKQARIAAGRITPSSAPLFGYGWDDPTPGAKNRYVEDPVTAAVVRRIFREAAAGRSLRAIGKGLTADGIPSRSGLQQPWPFISVRKVIENPFYLGKGWANRWRTDDHGKTKGMRPAEEWIALPEGAVAALVDEATWEAANAQLQRNRARYSGRNLTPEQYLLRGGFVFCGGCGRSMSCWRATPNGRGPVYLYRCNRMGDVQREPCPVHNILARTVDEAAWQRALSIVMRDDVLDTEIARLTTDASVDADVAAVERALVEVRSAQTNLAQALAKAPPIIQDRILGEMEGYAAREQALVGEREAITARQQHREALKLSAAALREKLRELIKDPEALTYVEKRLALEWLGIRAKVWPRGVVPRIVIEGPEITDSAVYPSCSAGEHHSVVTFRWPYGDSTAEPAAAD